MFPFVVFMQKSCHMSLLASAGVEFVDELVGGFFVELEVEVGTFPNFALFYTLYHRKST